MLLGTHCKLLMKEQSGIFRGKVAQYIENDCVLVATPISIPKTHFQWHCTIRGRCLPHQLHLDTIMLTMLTCKRKSAKADWYRLWPTFCVSNRQYVVKTGSLNRQTKATGINLCQKSEVYSTENLRSVILWSGYRLRFHQTQRFRNNIGKIQTQTQ